MKILALSDSHGNDLYIRELAKRANGTFDRCFHMGDIEDAVENIQKILNVPVDIVRGNCDVFSKYPTELFVKLGRHNCLLTHGHRYNAKRTMEELVYIAKQNDADYVFYGHTHRPYIEEIDGITLFNPGSIGRPYGESPSYGIIEVDNDGEIHLSLCGI